MRCDAVALAPELPLVVVVDDDEGMRTALNEILLSIGIEAASYATAAELRAARLPDRPTCLVLDVRLKEVNGLELQDELVRSGFTSPIILMTGYGDIPMCVRAMKAGAADFLTKPFRDQDLIDAVILALKQDEINRRGVRDAEALTHRFATLSPREQQVMSQVVAGRMNKQIAYTLGISLVTTKLHRGAAMRKMAAQSLADLVRMGEALGLGDAPTALADQVVHTPRC